MNGVEYTERNGVYGIDFNDNGKIALIKTPGGYFLPGGGIEDTESHSECLHREFLEETGYEIEIGNYIGNASLYHISKENTYINGIGYYYYVKLKDKVSHNIEMDHVLLWKEPIECIDCMFLRNQAWALEKVLTSCVIPCAEEYKISIRTENMLPYTYQQVIPKLCSVIFSCNYL